MAAYKNYFSEHPEISTNEQMEIVKRGDRFLIYRNADPLLTPGGHPFEHKSERLLRMIVTSALLEPGTISSIFSPLRLFCYQRDILENGTDPFPENWESVIEKDPFVRLKTKGRSGVLPFEPDHPLFNFSFITASSLVLSINELVNETIRDHDFQDSEVNPFLEIISDSYNDLGVEGKSVLQALSDCHDAGVVLPRGLIAGIITPTEYIHGLLALRIQEPSSIGRIQNELSIAMDYLACVQDPDKAGKTAFALIEEGESDTLEFKSTLRWDIRAGKSNQAIERACLKTIAAFLNTNGGTLLIGVRDDGSIEGIETDKFVNEDKFLLHLWTLIRTCLGRDVSPSIHTRLEKSGELTICVVKCSRHPRPVFLRQPGFPEEFFIRLGPASNAMDISEALKYISDHFKKET